MKAHTKLFCILLFFLCFQLIIFYGFYGENINFSHATKYQNSKENYLQEVSISFFDDGRIFKFDAQKTNENIIKTVEQQKAQKNVFYSIKKLESFGLTNREIVCYLIPELQIFIEKLKKSTNIDEKFGKVLVCKNKCALEFQEGKEGYFVDENLLFLDIINSIKNGEKEIKITRAALCPTCNGSKSKPGSEPQVCQTCGGTGQVKQVSNTILGQMMNIRPCRECGGTGKIITDPCDTCNGKGKIRESKEISIDIPAGVSEGDRLRVSGEGNCGETAGLEGNLIATIHIKNNRNFERDGTHLYYTKEISFPEASLGSEVTIPTIDGKEIELTIPAGTQSGSVFRVKNQGMPSLKYNDRGNMYVTVNVVVPQKLNKHQKELLEKFAKISGDEIKHTEKGFFDKFKEAINK